ncbi:SGNH/GDSL hydrolase family protein [Phenylobacterium sp.]|uniref:SGNH/GDSL hydrolase family protein n=1 Tax=Phenylobacterium sp. TaxID=1871053 RepID=UPI002728ED5D|nr:SGNH/GDSL hydrolase family protein [Phenylobacterium sp.]MDO8800038.1 SGNH/GDSL hydrolase family protein [Phenylobacterium sp.]
MAASNAYTLDPTKLFENGKTPVLVSPGGGNDYYNVGNGAYWRITEDASPVRYMEVDYWPTTTSNVRPAVRCKIGATVRDLWFAPPTATGALYTARILLPKNAKTIELYVPQQSAAAVGGAPTGSYPIRIRTDQPVSFATPSLLARHVVLYGDSIASGGIGASPAQFGYGPMLRRGAALDGIDASLTQVSHGYRLLTDDCNTSGKRTTFAALLLALSPTEIWLAIGSNDQAVLGGPTLANFTTYYEGLLDEIHAQSASMLIKCISPIRRSTEGANTNGETMAQFRSAISTAVTARSGWSVPPTYTDGLAMFADLTLLPDNVHPGTAGNVVMRDALKVI